MFHYRTDPAYGWIDANNLVESWHYNLEKHLFANKHQQKQQLLDTVIYVLVMQAIPYYQKRCSLHEMSLEQMPQDWKYNRVKINIARAYRRPNGGRMPRRCL
jgi:hypothetical protein